MPMYRKDWTLLAIAAAGPAASLSPVELQKSLFLLGRELASEVGEDFYEFEPYNYGPFDLSVYRDAESLEREGLVEISVGRYNRYRVTPRGSVEAGNKANEAPRQAVKYLTTAVRWTRSLSFEQLVRAIYAKYPEFRVNSVFSG